MGLRIAFFCMDSTFSVAPLEALIAAGHDVRFVLRPIGPLSSRNDPVLRRHRGFDVAIEKFFRRSDEHPRDKPLHVAARHDIPAWLCGNASTPAVQALLKKERIDLVVIAFFNQLLKPAIYECTPLGALNLHPSLLPHYRGPAPLFWMFKDGVELGGLSMHRVAQGEDDGGIYHQAIVPMSVGITGEELVDSLAERARRDLPDVVSAIAAGAAGVPQDSQQATRAPRPTAADVVVDGAIAARRIFHFVRGVGRWNPLVVDVAGQRLRVKDALGFDNTHVLPGEHALLGDVLHLGCVDGFVRLQL
jgi:methionyl-tRNA formyltransferase